MPSIFILYSKFRKFIYYYIIMYVHIIVSVYLLSFLLVFEEK